MKDMNPPTGNMPALQFTPPNMLHIDEGYQRSIDNPASQKLIRKIARDWDWSLCLPLVVARREGNAMFVIDGQHRLAAAKMRGDIQQMPCVIMDFPDPATEADKFVKLNSNRAPLTALDLFRAALASGDEDAALIMDAMTDAGLKLAKGTNNQVMPPATIGNVGGLRNVLKTHGERCLRDSLIVLASAYEGEVLRLAGTIFPGIATIVAGELAATKETPDDWEDVFPMIVEFVGATPQTEWRTLALEHQVANPNTRRTDAMIRTMVEQWMAFMSVEPA